MRRGPDALFVVTDALVAQSANVRFNEQVSSESELSSRLADIRGKLGIALSANESGHLVAAGPIVIGVRLARLSVASQSLGGGQSTDDVHPLSRVPPIHRRVYYGYLVRSAGELVAAAVLSASPVDSPKSVRER